MLRIIRTPEKSNGFGRVRTREFGYQRPACLPLAHRRLFRPLTLDKRGWKFNSLSAATNCTRFRFCKSDQLPKLEAYLHQLLYVQPRIRTRSHILSHDTGKPYLVPRHFSHLLWIRNVKITFPFTASNKLATPIKFLWIHIKVGFWALKIDRCYPHTVVNHALLRAHQQLCHDATTNNPHNTMQCPLCVSVCFGASGCPIS